jgi:hypothetical protein
MRTCELRLYHSAALAFPVPGANSIPAIVAQLGVDNIRAVPEPASVILFAAGLIALGSGHGDRPNKPTANHNPPGGTFDGRTGGLFVPRASRPFACRSSGNRMGETPMLRSIPGSTRRRQGDRLGC